MQLSMQDEADNEIPCQTEELDRSQVEDSLEPIINAKSRKSYNLNFRLQAINKVESG